MLLLCFSFGDGRFAMDASEVVEVVSMVRLEPVPRAPDHVAGIMRCHGRTVPVIDLCALAAGRPAKDLLSTRIIIARYPTRDGTVHELGLIAEGVTETMRSDAGDFVRTGVSLGETSDLGNVVYDDEGMIQVVDAAALLPESTKNILFQIREADG